MLLWFLFVGVVNILEVLGKSKYFLGSFARVATPFPFDQCVILSDGHGHIYSCNENGTVVTRRRYGEAELECTGPPTTDETYTSDDADFDCFGVDNYAEVTLSVDIDAGIFSEFCLPITVTSLATNVCYYDSDLTSWIKVECNETESTLITTFHASDSTCLGTPVRNITAGECHKFGTFIYQNENVTGRTSVTSCVKGETPAPVPVPSIPPTESKVPTVIPSQSPTNLPTEPTEPMSTANDTLYSQTTNKPSTIPTQIPTIQTTEQSPDATSTNNNNNNNEIKVDLSEYNSRYIYASFGGSVSIPFPIDTCVQTGLGSPVGDDEYPYSLYSCQQQQPNSEEYIVTKTEYSSDDCSSDSVGSQYIYTQQNSSFNCVGRDNYASLQAFIKVGSNQCALRVGTLYTAVGVCFQADIDAANYSSSYAAITCANEGIDESINFLTFESNVCNDTAQISTISADNCTLLAEEDGTTLSYKPTNCIIDNDVSTTEILSTMDELIPTEPKTNRSGSNNDDGEVVLAMIIVSLVLLILMIIGCVMYLYVQKMKHNNEESTANSVNMKRVQLANVKSNSGGGNLSDVESPRTPVSPGPVTPVSPVGLIKKGGGKDGVDSDPEDNVKYG